MPFSTEHLKEIIAASERGYPNEACGIIAGASWNEARHVEMENVYDRYHAHDPEAFPRTARTAYKMNDLKRARIVEEAGGLLCIWHSHTDVGAYFSDEDVRAALGGGSEPLFPNTRYLVVSCREGRVDGALVFDWDSTSRTFVETSIELPGIGA